MASLVRDMHQITRILSPQATEEANQDMSLLIRVRVAPGDPAAEKEPLTSFKPDCYIAPLPDHE
jgi:hypothetical protein